ncbi:protein tyrosine kinase [Frankia sp. CcI49]|uniref:polysaccharide biosynthesis tyrosine autokinase n=1 Tax=Frankia sp. CcI49 TaxID=1745382 RepID=UPI0009765046|nr:polysaccharide biosynthesis tyrosine autokinase [Frankia sp. CcI49]ONH60217.1 protein tyrosine kinase [Frankia sp. CcI49]
MELREYVHVLRRSWLLVLACVLLGGLLAATASWRQTKMYAASVTMVVSSSDEAVNAASAYQGGLLSQQRVKSYANLVASERVASDVIARLHLAESPADLRARIEAQAVPDTVLLRAVVRDADPQRAKLIADSVGEAFSAAVERIERPSEDEPPSVHVRVWERAKAPTAPISPQPVRNVVIGLLLGVIVGIAAGIGRHRLDTSIGGDSDASVITGAATLGMIGYDSDASRHPLIVHLSPHSRRAEAFRQLRTNLQFVNIDTGPRSILVTSSVAQEGKSTTVCNLAIALAQGGARVCLVEGDLRRPSFGEYLGIESAAGLTSVLIGAAELDDVLQPWGEGRVGDGRVEILPSGPVPPNPSELLGSRNMAELLEVLDSRFDIVLIDTPPLLPVTDAAVLATRVDGALLVARTGRTRREQLRRAVGALRAVDANLLGTVLTMMPTKGANSHYYGSYETYAPHPRHLRSRGEAGFPNESSPAIPAQGRARATSAAGTSSSDGRPTDGRPVDGRPADTRVADGRAAKPTAAARKAATRAAVDADSRLGGRKGSRSKPRSAPQPSTQPATSSSAAEGTDQVSAEDSPAVEIAAQRQPDEPTAPLAYGTADYPDHPAGR